MDKTQTVTEFLASLPAPLTRRGPGSSSTKACAERVRKEIALAIKAGIIPAGAKVSVRCDRSSMRVEVTAWVGAVFSDEWTEALMEIHTGTATADNVRRERWAPALRDALRTIEQIADRHNYNNSDLMTDYFDVGYYLNVSAGDVETAAEMGIKAEVDPEFRDLVARAHAAAKALGPKVVASVCGRGGVVACGEYSLDRLIRMAERANGAELAYDRRRGWQVAA